jgi:hypothetical protein
MTGTASSQVAEIIHPVRSARPQIRPENFSERTSLVISLGLALLMAPCYEIPSWPAWKTISKSSRDRSEYRSLSLGSF